MTSQVDQRPPSLLSEAFFADPYPVYRRLREAGALHWDDAIEGWLVTRYRDVARWLRDPRMSSRRSGGLFARLTDAERERLAPLRRFFSLWMLFSDPPGHDRVRAAVSAMFKPAVVAGLAGDVERMADDLLGRTAGRGGLEVLSEFARPLSVHVVARIIGVDAPDVARVKRWSDDILTVFGGHPGGPDAATVAQDSLAEVLEYLREAADHRRRRPREDLLSHLLARPGTAGALTEEEILATCANLLVDGHGPVADGIGNGLYTLLRHPEQYERLRREPGRCAAAVEECLRYESPFQIVSRRPREDVTVGGRVVSQGQRVWLVLGAANHDPDYVADPDRFDIARAAPPHLAFGSGLHTCLGAMVGRLTMTIALRSFVRHGRGARLDGADPPRWRPTFSFRGLTSLSVRRDEA